ncbi:single-stranded DNA-binding protein [Kocuria nitroreducens]|uniref:single-stranded DNA-binding protein n=1 Tax=Kocuria nitroreducens TaxID=3058914 RepID=UPI0036DC1028
MDGRNECVVAQYGHTNWFSVQAFRSLGLNALASIKKGQPVVVVGKLKVRFWEGEHGRHTAVDVDAVSLGHDLALGTACFQRTVSSSPPADQTGEQPADQPEDAAATDPSDRPTAPQGDPTDASDDPSHGSGTPGVPEDVDPETGELLGSAAAPGRRSRRQPAAT